MRLAADGLSRLTEYGASQGLNVIVENHGGLSSNGAWLAGVMKMVNHPVVERCPISAISTSATERPTTVIRGLRN